MQNFPGDIDVHFVERSERFDDFCDEFPVDYLQALGAGGCGHHGGEASFDHLVAAMKDRAGFQVAPRYPERLLDPPELVIIANDFRRGDSGGWHVHDTAFQPDQPTSRVEGLRGEGLLAVQGFHEPRVLDRPDAVDDSNSPAGRLRGLLVSLAARFRSVPGLVSRGGARRPRQAVLSLRAETGAPTGRRPRDGPRLAAGRRRLSRSSSPSGRPSTRCGSGPRRRRARRCASRRSRAGPA